MFKLTINVNRLCCVFSFLRLKMANLSDLMGFASTVTHAKPGAKPTKSLKIIHFEQQKRQYITTEEGLRLF